MSFVTLAYYILHLLFSEVGLFKAELEVLRPEVLSRAHEPHLELADGILIVCDQNLEALVEK